MLSFLHLAGDHNGTGWVLEHRALFPALSCRLLSFQLALDHAPLVNACFCFSTAALSHSSSPSHLSVRVSLGTVGYWCLISHQLFLCFPPQSVGLPWLLAYWTQSFYILKQLIHGGNLLLDPLVRNGGVVIGSGLWPCYFNKHSQSAFGWPCQSQITTMVIRTTSLYPQRLKTWGSRMKAFTQQHYQDAVLMPRQRGAQTARKRFTVWGPPRGSMRVLMFILG